MAEQYEKMKAFRNRDDHRFMSYLGIKVTDVREGYARGELVIKEIHENMIGSVHGGCILSLADSVCGAAASSYGLKMTTISSDFHFLLPAIGIKKLIAIAKVIKRGKKIVVCDVEVCDENDKLIGKGTFPFYNLGTPFLEDEIKKDER